MREHKVTKQTQCELMQILISIFHIQHPPIKVLNVQHVRTQ